MKKVTAVFVALLLFSSGSLFAGELGTDTLILSLGQGADIGSTYWALDQCPTCREGGLLRTADRVVAGKVLFSGATVLLCHQLRKSGHKKEARWVAIGVALAGGALAVHNMKKAHR